ncbi:tyrosine-protein kinase Lyn-like [Branchiostoma floridae]|uniref:Tyrosine-protein kinase Lyn-like n=1 Tax=Branchiostoma floridae TaxID=7739 RepID=A0A9J7MVK1_BRAFL|nr:tyrosine-protein kinase Lyn-like [Branchiostoma floridae]
MAERNMAQKVHFHEDEGQRFDKVDNHGHDAPDLDADGKNLISIGEGADSKETSYYSGNTYLVHEDNGTSDGSLEKEVENLTISNGDDLEASAESAPLGAGLEQGQRVSSKEIYAASSSNSLFPSDGAEWKLDESTFLDYADEQCRSTPRRCRRVTQGLIYNKVISPTSQEYRQGKEWKLGECLGSGTFGEVYKCESLSTREHYAVKKVPTTSPDGQERPGWARLEEIKLWQKLGNHPNVCELYGVTYEDKAFWFHMELVKFAEDPAPNLPAYVTNLNPNKQIPIVGLLKAGGGLFEGLGYMHQQESTHRDLSNAKNVMVGTGFQLKIIDFSFIRTATEDKHFDKDLKGGLACFFQLVTRKKKDPDNWTSKALENCLKDKGDVQLLLPLCQQLISHLDYPSGRAINVARWMAEDINRWLANILLETQGVKHN